MAKIKAKKPVRGATSVTGRETLKKKSVKPTKKEVSEIKPVVGEAEEMTEDLDLDLSSKPDRYFEAIGRRKTAVARVRLFTRGDKVFLINNKPYKEYFPLEEYQQLSTSSMRKMKCLDKFRIQVIVRGGGQHAQAEAIRHGTARVLVDFNANFRKRLRKAGYLTRDPRMRERKKFGLKRARKAPQWAKR